MLPEKNAINTCGQDNGKRETMRRKQVIQNKIKELCILILVFCMVVVSESPVEAAEAASARTTIKAGFFAWDGYHVMDDKGVCSGYGYDFLKMTEGYTNWKIEFVGYDKTWSDMLEMLDSGEIDLLTSAQKTPEWEEKYEFSNKPIGTSSTILSVRKEETQYVVGDTSTYSGMKIGCLKDSSRNDRFADFARENSITYEYVYYDDMEELKAALMNKEVDAVLSTNLRTLDNETVLEVFDPVDYYVIVKKGNTELMEQVNQVISQMDYNTPSWKEQLQQRYYSNPNADEMIFDKEQLDYLEEIKSENKVFTVVTNPDLAPYSSFDKEGKPQGIVPKLFKELADEIGLQYEFVSFDTYEDYNTFVKAGKADIDLTCFHDYGLAAAHGIALTNSYISTSMAMLTKKNNSGSLDTIGMIEGSVNNTIYSGTLFDNHSVKKYETNAQGIEAVASGKVDVLYQYAYSAQKAVKDDPRNRLMYTILPQYEISMCIGINDNLDNRLVEILNEGIRALSNTYVQGLIEDEVSQMTENVTLYSVMMDHPFYFVLIIFLIAGSFMATLYVFWKRKQTETLLLRESQINAARTEFFMIISHELRTPLNAVVSYLRLTREKTEENDEKIDYIEKAQSAAQQLTEISDSMLDYANISTGKIKLNEGIVKIKDLILHVNQIMAVKAKEKKQNFEFTADHISRLYFFGDALRLSLIFQNILENAIKFTPEGGNVKAEIHEEIVNSEMVQLIFRCEDTGKGMSQEFIDKINTAFHQSDASYSRTHGGLGLGLFLTQFFVNMMGGTFQVESEEGKGSKFVISIPMRCPTVAQLVENNVKCRQVRAIIQDDKEENVNYAKNSLKEIGVKADFVADSNKLVRKIMSRTGGAYQYAVCIINIDQEEKYEELTEQIYSMDQAPEIYWITMNKELLEKGKDNPKVQHSIYIPESDFELFNAFITEFGEFELSREKKTIPDYNGIHAMIVEDNKINADILNRILHTANITTTICENGQLAVDLFEKEKEDTFQIIFMDIQMPVMNGYDATRLIRKSHKEQGKLIPIIAVSANSFSEDVKKSMESGMNDHIAKPVDDHLIYEEIEKHIVHLHRNNLC